MPHVKGLAYHPIKSLKGIPLQKMTFGLKGPVDDRRWMVINPSGRFISQRKYPKMSTITVEVGQEKLEISAEGFPILEEPLKSTGRPVTTTVWRHIVEAELMSDHAHQWFSEVLETPCRLVTMAPTHRRIVDQDYALSSNDEVDFADGYPVMITNQASLEELNTRLENPVTMERFRGNIVIEGCPAWDEDLWEILRIGDLTFTKVKPCARCVLINVDQETGIKGLEPLTTLATYRKRSGGRIIFGENVIHSGPGTIAIGDEVEIVRMDPAKRDV